MHVGGSIRVLTYSRNDIVEGQRKTNSFRLFLSLSLTEDEASIPCARAAESASDMAAAGADSPGLFDDAGVSSHEGTGRGFHFWKYLVQAGFVI